jgi:predicted SAM-dependent methyltransferase
MKERFLNLGCGTRFHPDWENVDIYPSGPGVRVHDLHNRTPYSDETFEIVYHSHVLEHFPRKQALVFLQECHRVLKSGGVIRVAVPDLECIVRLYLESLEKASNGVPGWADNYEWMIMEMYDQTVRESSGGDMPEFVRRARIGEREFIRQRLGGELDRMLVSELAIAEGRRRHPFRLVHRFAGAVRRKILRLLIGSEGIRAYDLGRFRLSGELHRWMYDRYSLARALERGGFSSTRAVGPTESAIPDWSGFHLDTEPDGSVYKPDSLYMEATRP